MISRKNLMKKTGVSVDTLKHYRKIGILCPVNEKELETSDKNHKHQWLYDDSAVGILNLITIYKELGYSLDDIKNKLKNDSIDFKNNISSAIRSLEKKRQEIDYQIGYLSALSELSVLDEFSMEQLDSGCRYLSKDAKNDIKGSRDAMLELYREVYDALGAEYAARLLETFRYVYKFLMLMAGGAEPGSIEVQDAFGDIIEGLARSVYENEINESGYDMERIRRSFFIDFTQNIYSEDMLKQSKACLSQEGLAFFEKTIMIWKKNNNIK